MPPLDIRAPRSRAEDRLWCPTIAAEPPLHDWSSDLDAGRTQLRSLLSRAECVAAVDAGSVDGWAAWAVALLVQGKICTVAAPVQSLDAAPLLAELWALAELADGAMEVRSQDFWHVWCDNCTALDMATESHLCNDYWRLFNDTNRRWFRHSAVLEWVPAHARHPEWNPSPPFTATFIRQLNMAADVACTQMLSRMRGIDRQSRCGSLGPTST